MRVRSPELLMLLCVCLLAMQVSGLHLHASLDGSNNIHGTSALEFDPDGHGHEEGSDVSFLESATGWVKPLPFLVLFISALFACILIRTPFWTPVTKLLHFPRHIRWRPPLRAPPLLVS
jgi:hypothetical protein